MPKEFLPFFSGRRDAEVPTPSDDVKGMLIKFYSNCFQMFCRSLIYAISLKSDLCIRHILVKENNAFNLIKKS